MIREVDSRMLPRSLDAEDPWTRCAAVLVLGSDPANLEWLIGLLESDEASGDPLALAGAAYAAALLPVCPSSARDALREVYQGVLGEHWEGDLRIIELFAEGRAERARTAARMVREAMALRAEAQELKEAA